MEKKQRKIAALVQDHTLPFHVHFVVRAWDRTKEGLAAGPRRTLVGVKTFSGSDEEATPQHAVLLGMSGAGKSVTVCDLLSQTEAYFGYTVIIEEGLSYGLYTQTVEPNARPSSSSPMVISRSTISIRTSSH
ncbi:MAG: hypothetical protein M3463_12455 [Verrucomicrobiota bacterium]|nr:hypothetical protein [Verrucomicrobiota bacterium]